MANARSKKSDASRGQVSKQQDEGGSDSRSNKGSEETPQRHPHAANESLGHTGERRHIRSNQRIKVPYIKHATHHPDTYPYVYLDQCYSYEDLAARTYKKKNVHLADCHFIGVITNCKKKMNVQNSTYASGQVVSRSYDRYFTLYDVLHKFGMCVAIRFHTSNESSKFFERIVGDGTEPLVGTPILIKDFYIPEDRECLTSDNDIPIIKYSGTVHILMRRRHYWTFNREFAIDPSNSSRTTRAFTIKNHYLSIRSLKVIRSNCGNGTCDRNLFSPEQKCICISQSPGNSGQLVLIVQFNVHKSCDAHGNVQGEPISQEFHQFQSMRFSNYLLGPSFSDSCATEEEWSQCKNGLLMYVEERLRYVNREKGGWNIFGWYKNGTKSDIIKSEGDRTKPSQANGSRVQAKRDTSVEYFHSTSITLHIVRCTPSDLSALHEPFEHYRMSIDPEPEVLPIEEAVDTIVDTCPFAL